MIASASEAAPVPSDAGQSLAVSGSHTRHVFQLSRVRDVVARLVLGQDLHQGAELQPPLVLRHPVTGEVKGQVSGSQDIYLFTHSDHLGSISELQLVLVNKI